MPPAPSNTNQTQSLTQQVRNAVIWRSGSQIAAQIVQWASTFLVIRILAPSDYGLFALTGVVMAFLNMLNGYGLASGLVREAELTTHQIRQAFGMLIALNVGLGAIQLGLAPAAAAYYRQPEVAALLRVQALIYLFTPFIALPQALLSRSMDYRRQGRINIISSVVGAGTALVGAFSGWGVWTLVIAPMALFATRAVGMTVAAGSIMMPSFDFRGAGSLARFGGVMAAGQLFWFIQSQIDVFIAGRHLDLHDLGIYTTSLFLAQIFVSKFVPPLNEVAFSAYARIQHDRAATAAAFTKGVRIVMLAALPFYFGLAVTADPLVRVMLGEQWADAAIIVRLLAIAMPFMTLQVLFSPACDALGRPGVGVANGAAGSAILAAGFLVGIQWGLIGIAAAWIVCYPVYLAVSCWRALPVIGARARDVAAAVAPSLLAAAAMAIAVTALDHSMVLAPLPRLCLLVTAGAAVYAGWLALFARGVVQETLALIRNRR
ncbi:Membrane protein involved in the export of O-antigen and teichoic acid [Sphingomonas sp. OV641]|uniref:lipopolysaccharide biosynthesis protein n=1 Tax=Sphingomonas sp. OV641 TaxID=1881068 RepID=UPI0008D6A450|nr:lipopolysaccharide biosynthesis protein [Sphingomonas sp. OV641]SEJ70413.1 Membrane protein involved in the export of O-antigen and teichoic acid [Sphingomonas sp. OV641]